MGPETKQCQNCKQNFTIEPEDFGFFEKMGVPAPKECHTCIWKNLLAFWVFGRFRKTTSALSGQSIITTLPDTVPFPIYSFSEWVSGSWDPLEYGSAYDPTRSFFDQLRELVAKTPHPHQSGVKNVKCEWSDDVWNCKNCYLCRSLADCENGSYLYRTVRCKDSFDLTFSFDMEFSYDCCYSFKCYKVRHAFDARDCLESAFLYDCRNCQSCLLCWNLRNKQYCIKNVQYTREAYLEKIKEFDLRSRSAVATLTAEFQTCVTREAFHRADYNNKTVASTGNFLEECKNCSESYFLQRSEDCLYFFRGMESKDAGYTVGSAAVEKGYLSCLDYGIYDCVATSHSSNCRYSAYLDYCEECEYCLGCSGLRKKKFCILNKQYSEEEYRELSKKIQDSMKAAGEWGQYFPWDMAYCGYNVSTGQFYFPMEEKEVQAVSGVWDDPKEVVAEGTSADQVPDLIDDVPDDIWNKALICLATGYRFNLAPHELQFYKAEGIAAPRYAPDYRTRERFRPVSVGTPFVGICTNCQKSITHFYPPQWGYQNILCLECYHNQVQ